MTKATQKAHTLVEAFKYIKQFEGKIFVIKYGGNAMESEELKNSVFTDISILNQLGINVIVVHGGGPEVDKAMKEANLKKKAIDGLRVTDEKTLDIVKKVFNDINKDCVALLKSLGNKAKDLTDNLILTRINEPKLGFVGKIVNINPSFILNELKKGVIPVVSSLGKDNTGQMTNINADTVATRLAIVMGAEKLTILTNVDGVKIKGNFMDHLSIDDVEKYIEKEEITEGMIPKVKACMQAVNHGVRKAHLINGTLDQALLLEIFTDKGIGTEIVKNENA